MLLHFLEYFFVAFNFCLSLFFPLLLCNFLTFFFLNILMLLKFVNIVSRFALFSLFLSFGCCSCWINNSRENEWYEKKDEQDYEDSHNKLMTIYHIWFLLFHTHTIFFLSFFFSSSLISFLSTTHSLLTFLSNF